MGKHSADSSLHHPILLSSCAGGSSADDEAGIGSGCNDCSEWL